MVFSSAFAGAELEASSSVSSSSLECAAQPSQKALSGPEDNLTAMKVYLVKQNTCRFLTDAESGFDR